MADIINLEPKNVFRYFSEICAIPHGSENMDGIAGYCIDFAKRHSLNYYHDDANNVVIYKNATPGYESSAPVILQGHLDMVCQKSADSEIDFLTDGLEIYEEDGFVKASGTTLGADNGIAVALILAILADTKIHHPMIEAVFTTDEEIGMIGAGKLDMSVLSAKRMINLDAEEDDTVTVSCAGGSDFKANIKVNRAVKHGCYAKLVLKGFRGGHSGVEINSGRVNSNMLAGRLLDSLENDIRFDIIGINGGDKGNAITNRTDIELCVYDPVEFKLNVSKYIDVIEDEISFREPGFSAELTVDNKSADYEVFDGQAKSDIIFALCCAPGGVIEMSREIPGLVETSLNLGVLQTECDDVTMHFTLRSNKTSALRALEARMNRFFSKISATVTTFGFYPPWEYKKDSELRTVFVEAFSEICDVAPKVEAIHAGLECGLFSSRIEGLDCIAIGPQLYDVHTVSERLSVSSTSRTYSILLNLLERLK